MCMRVDASCTGPYGCVLTRRVVSTQMPESRRLRTSERRLAAERATYPFHVHTPTGLSVICERL